MWPAVFGIACTAFGSAIGYFVTRYLDRRPEHNRLDLEKKRLDNATSFVKLCEEARKSGFELTVQPLTFNVEAIHRMNGEEAWKLLRQWFLVHVNQLYHAAMRMEEVWHEHPEYEDLLSESQKEFVTAMGHCRQLEIAIAPKQIEPVLVAYYEYCRNPCAETAEAVGRAQAGVDWKQFNKEVEELTTDEEE